LDTGANKSNVHSSRSQVASAAVIGACSAAAEELKAARTLVNILENENASMKARLETEKRSNALLTELNETRRSENEALHATLAAKNETISAKDAVIVSQDKMIETVKKKKSSPWRRLGDILIGAALFAVLK
jgi:septal ring factor EnvC (AmiA/AmiB activator)